MIYFLLDDMLCIPAQKMYFFDKKKSLKYCLLGVVIVFRQS